MTINWAQVLAIVMYLLEKIKDSDGDGKIDIFDKEPENPNES